MKLFLSLSLCSFLFIMTSVVFAQEEQPLFPEVQEEQVVSDGVDSPQLIDVLAKIENETTAAISFSILNTGEELSNLVYALDLVKVTETGSRILIDRTTFDDVVSITKGSVKTKDITYTFPVNLSGSYELVLMLGDTQGSTYHTEKVITLTLAPRDGDAIMILPETCTIGVQGGVAVPAYETVTITRGSVLESSCAVQFLGRGGTMATALLRTYGMYDVLPLALEDLPLETVTFLEKEEKNVKTYIPTAGILGTYTVFLSYGAAENIVGYTYTVVEGNAAPTPTNTEESLVDTMTPEMVPPLWINIGAVLLAVLLLLYMRRKQKNQNTSPNYTVPKA